jgi:type IV pilus assembly protein PilE
VRARSIRPAGAAQSGITLIELMIVVAIIAIITAVAYPSYQDHIRKARRIEGKSALLRAMQLQERAYTANQTYQTDLGPLFGLAAGAAVRSGEDPATGNYDLTAVPDPASGDDLRFSVLIRATPRAPFSDVDCGVLSLTTTGTRTADGVKGTASTTPGFCWER